MLLLFLRKDYNVFCAPLDLRWNSSKAPGFGSGGSDSCCPLVPLAAETGETVGMVKPAGTEIKPGPAWTGGGGLGELAASTLPILGKNTKQIQVRYTFYKITRTQRQP